MALLPEIQRVVRGIDPDIPVEKPQIISDAFAETYLMPTLTRRCYCHYPQ
jgi:hypothetical protein